MQNVTPFLLYIFNATALGKPQAIISKEQAKEMETDFGDDEPRLRPTRSKNDAFPRSLSSKDGNNTCKIIKITSTTTLVADQSYLICLS